MHILMFLFLCLLGGFVLLQRAPAAGVFLLLIGGFGTWAVFYGIYHPAPAQSYEQVLAEHEAATTPTPLLAARRANEAKPLCTKAQLETFAARYPDHSNLVSEAKYWHPGEKGVLFTLDEDLDLNLPCRV